MFSVNIYQTEWAFKDCCTSPSLSWAQSGSVSSRQVDRHLRKLDQELAKFKMELEADNAGITEILERRESLTAA